MREEGKEREGGKRGRAFISTHRSSAFSPGQRERPLTRAGGSSKQQQQEAHTGTVDHGVHQDINLLLALPYAYLSLAGNSSGIHLTAFSSFLVCVLNLNPNLPSVSKLSFHLSGTGLRSTSQ